MGLDQILIFALTWGLAMVLKKWPSFKDEYIPRVLWVMSVLFEAINKALAASVGPIPAVHTSYAAAAAVVPIPGVNIDPTVVLYGTGIWIGTQVVHLVSKVLKDVFKLKLPSWL